MGWFGKSAQEWFDEAQAALEEDRTEDALRVLDEALRKNPQFAAAHLAKVGALMSEGRVDAAMDSLNEGIELCPGNPDLLHQQAVFLSAGGEIEDALGILDQSYAIAPTDQNRLTKGQILFDEGRFPEAIAALDQALTPRCTMKADILKLKFGVLMTLARFDEAEAAARKIMALDPDSAAESQRVLSVIDEARRQKRTPGQAQATFWCNKADDIFREDADLDKASKCLDKALALDPACERAMVNYGYMLDESGRSKDAIPWYDRALALAPNDSAAWSNRGNSLMSIGKFQEANESFQKALAINPKEGGAQLGLFSCGMYAKCRADVFAYVNRAHHLVKMRKPDEALVVAQKAIQLDPNDGVACEMMATCLMYLNRTTEALPWFDRALRAYPHNPIALSNRGMTLGILKRFAEAVPYYQKAAQLTPGLPHPWSNLGECQEQCGQFNEGMSSFEKALSIDPECSNALYGKAKCLMGLERWVDAQDAFMQFIRCAGPADSEKVGVARMMVEMIEQKRLDRQFN